MTLPPPSEDRVLSIYLTLNQYPILSARIRARMREEIFGRGIITPEAFEEEVRQKAIESQKREGLQAPYFEEPAAIWEMRLERIRAYLTDFYFAYNLPYEEFEAIVRQAISERSHERPDLITFNPELAPQDMLFAQAEAIEAMPAKERARYEARLQEIKAVLIRTMISDQLAYINLARRWFKVADLKEIRNRKIGQGKIGGKAAGMLLAARILQEVGGEELHQCLRLPVSYYIGSDVLYSFMSLNRLLRWGDQKYKPEEQIRAEYPVLRREFAAGRLPDDILATLKVVLEECGRRPLIVRSSSLLEDNFGTSFAGKYESFFLPNQGTLEENLKALSKAIALIYASGLNPDVLLYRRQKGLIDYDERLAILLQIVEGEPFGSYHLPHAAGVAFSRNLYRWSPQIRKEDGFVRLVWGLGTRAVEQTGNDFPRLVALSHPTLYPADSVKAIRHYSQQYVDLIDLAENKFRTLPVHTVLNGRYPPARYIAQVEEEGYLASLRSALVDSKRLVITFDELLRRTPFAERMRTMLKLLETHYQTPVDVEFTLHIHESEGNAPRLTITLLQCRPQSHFSDEGEVTLPDDLPAADMIFATSRMVPRGTVSNIRYVLFVTEAYFALGSAAERAQLRRAIGEINARMTKNAFLCVGPGRWGTATPELGVHVGYGDIYNTCALVELSGKAIGTSPEPSFGTHFFQDLMEARIFPLAICLQDREAVFNHAFFYETPNRVLEFTTVDEKIQACLRLIAVADFRPAHHLKLVMNDDLGRAVAYLEADALDAGSNERRG
jgi:hypothetical protein